MKIINIILIPIYLLLFINFAYGQDTIRIEEKPQVIIKSWYPEFKEFPSLNIGEQKIIFTTIPELENLPIRDNNIELRTSNSKIEITETDKPNQYLVVVKESIITAGYVEFEIWFEIGDRTILLSKNDDWINVIEYYPMQNNRILLDIIKLQLRE